METDEVQPQLNPHGLHPSPIPSLNIDASFKLDEGYSEDTRSLADDDSAMGMEPRTAGSPNLMPNPLAALENAVAALDEAQRSGET